MSILLRGAEGSIKASCRCDTIMSQGIVVTIGVNRWWWAALVACLTVGACHRRPPSPMEDLGEAIASMERTVVAQALLRIFPDEEGWLVLPGLDGAGVGTFLGGYRVVGPGPVQTEWWTRFLRAGVEVEEVVGSATLPQREPVPGFRGLFLRVAVRGVEACVVLVDEDGMRWVAWYEGMVNRGREAVAEGRGLEVAKLMAQGAPLPHGVLDSIPPPRWSSRELWEQARRAPWRLKGLPAPPFWVDERAWHVLVGAAPQDSLVNVEPVLLDRMLAALRGRRVVLRADGSPALPQGFYVWAVSTLGQARAAPVDSGTCSGPSALFFGRPVKAVGTLVVHPDGNVDLDVFPAEYGCCTTCGEGLHRVSSWAHLGRAGHLLVHLPRPGSGKPGIRVGPVLNPWPCAWGGKVELDG